MRLALLKADYVNDDLIGPHGDLPDMFRRFFADIEIDAYEVRFGAFPAVSRYDACVISGSRYSVNDDIDWVRELLAFLRLEGERGTPLVGFCFGHQALAKAFGGSVGKGPADWNVGLWPVKIEETASEIHGLFNHREQVLALPNDARLIAGTARCPVQAFALGRHMLGIQFHPEYTLDYQEAIMAVPKTMPRAIFDDAIRRNRTLTRTDGIVRSWALRCAQSRLIPFKHPEV